MDFGMITRVQTENRMFVKRGLFTRSALFLYQVRAYFASQNRQTIRSTTLRSTKYRRDGMRRRIRLLLGSRNRPVLQA